MRRQSHSTPYAPLFPFLGHAADSIVADGEIVVVNFAGIGGACHGLERALRRPVTYAINHNPVAIGLHRRNSPHTTHFVQDVWAVDPAELAGARRIAAAWFSPDCKHFSKAKGGKPVEKNIRDLAWVTTKYTALPEHVRPRVVFLENVEEFADWGPLSAEGKPDKARKGETFREFVATIQSHGYAVEWRILRACEYGAPTSRKRLFMIARCDGEAIRWPQPTHGKPSDPRVLAGTLQPYRTAAECIDWDRPTPSIFTRRKPLVPNTMNRIAQGMKRFVLEAAEPFLVTCNHAGEHFRGQGLDEPMRTVTAARDAHGLNVPDMVPFIANNQFGNVSRGADQPLSTITTNPTKNNVVAGYITKVSNGDPTRFRGQPVSEALATVTCSNEHFLVSAHLVQHYGGNIPPQDLNFPVNQPTRTIMAQGGKQNLVSGALVACGGRGAQARPKAFDEPMHTITSKADMCVATAYLTAYYGADGRNDQGQPVTTPLHTIATKSRFGLTTAFLHAYYSQGKRRDSELNKGDPGQPVDVPLRTISASGNHHSPVTVHCAPALTEAQQVRARQVHDYLWTYLGAVMRPYSVGGLIVLQIRSEWYVLADIGMRMLTPRELARCQGFPDSFVLDETADGTPVTQEQQVNGVGNSVCPAVSEHLALANLTLSEAAD